MKRTTGMTLGLIALALTGCTTVQTTYFARGSMTARHIHAVASYPNLPSDYAYYDYRAQAQALDQVLFSFAENPTTLAPMAKYDPRYAADIGKYFVNLVSNARHFFPQEVSFAHQSMDAYLPFDDTGAVAYEGLKNTNSGYATGDATSMFGEPCDLSVYSSARGNGSRTNRSIL